MLRDLEQVQRLRRYELQAALQIARARGITLDNLEECAAVLDTLAVLVVPPDLCVVPRVTVSWTLARVEEWLRESGQTYPETLEQVTALKAAL